MSRQRRRFRSGKVGNNFSVVIGGVKRMKREWWAIRPASKRLAEVEGDHINIAMKRLMKALNQAERALRR